MAGTHGDEFEGQIALTKICRELAPEDIRGRLVVLTMTNYPAALAGLRNSPIDDGNLNRTYPGDPLGSPTQMIAHYIETVLMPMCDYAVDLHSGGSSLFYQPTLLRGRGGVADETATLEKLQTAFDAPYAWVFTSGGGRNSTARTSMGAANRNGVISIMAELGGGGSVSPEILALTERGTKRVLHAIGLLARYRPDAANGTRELRVQGSIYSYDVGVFEPYLEVGDTVVVGEEIGAVHYSEEPWRAPSIITAIYDGMILCRRFQGRVERGDCVYQIATDLDAPD